MNVQQKIEKWCRNERFVRYANERISEELVYAPNNRIVPMMTYLPYRLKLVKLQKNAKNRNRRVWWIFVHVIMREDYTQLFDGKFEKFLTELHDTVMTMLHDEYTRLSNKKK